MTVTNIVTSDGWRAQVTGSGYNNVGVVQIQDFSDSEIAQMARSSIYNVLEVGCVCNNAAISPEGSLRGQPTEGALLAAAMKYGMHACSSNYHRLQEYPFNSDMKIMTVRSMPRAAHNEARKEIYFSKGAIEKILQ